MKCNDNNSGTENFIQNDAPHSGNNNQGNEGICRVDKFEVIKYSIGDNEKQPKGIAANVLVRIGKFVFPIDFVILGIPEDNNVPLILRRPFLFTTHVKIDVYKRKVTLRVREENLVFKSVKPASSIIKKVFMDE
ncbi:putative reverse transcriptase domain-containing protein [Tanacetum coccineum]